MEAWDISDRAKLEYSITHNHDQFQVAHPPNIQTTLELCLRTTEIGSWGIFLLCSMEKAQNF